MEEGSGWRKEVGVGMKWVEAGRRWGGGGKGGLGEGICVWVGVDLSERKLEFGLKPPPRNGGDGLDEFFLCGIQEVDEEVACVRRGGGVRLLER